MPYVDHDRQGRSQTLPYILAEVTRRNRAIVAEERVNKNSPSSLPPIGCYRVDCLYTESCIRHTDADAICPRADLGRLAKRIRKGA